LFSKIDIDIKNTFFPNDFAPNFEDYDKKIESCGGIDLQILGIGRNGHIGFNEPGSDFDSKSREVQLTEATIKDNARFFNNINDVPQKATTMGMATIMKAKKIIILANGESKKEIIHDALFGPISEKVPASMLQKHKNVTIILDKLAAEKIKN
jgi:glucosamine-6-phosphate deaminase